jgi:uncharacterized protein with von Willebrand factor type A (vWA) domain
MTDIEKSPAHSFLEFIAFLRERGFLIGLGEAADATAIAARFSPETSKLKPRLKILLSKSRSQWDDFDRLFNEFWFPDRKKRPAMKGEVAISVVTKSSGVGAHNSLLDEFPPIGDAEVELGYDASGSGAESLSSVNLDELASSAEREMADRIARQIAKSIKQRQSRRRRPAHRGSRIDLRRTMRKSLRFGGDPLELAFKKPLHRPQPVILLLDVSGSMRSYARAFLAFAHGLAGRWIDVRVYLMHTALVDASEVMKERDPHRAAQKFADIAVGFGGGTRLGACFRTFNNQIRQTSSLRRALVFILSDGYDSGSEDLFATEFAAIADRTRRMIWLNPLCGRASYRPVTLAMLSAMNRIDHLVPADTLESFLALESYLARG